MRDPRIDQPLRDKESVDFLNEIRDAYLGELGDQEGRSTSCHVGVKLSNGKDIALFVSACDETFDLPAVDHRRQRLAD